MRAKHVVKYKTIHPYTKIFIYDNKRVWGTIITITIFRGCSKKWEKKIHCSMEFILLVIHVIKLFYLLLLFLLVPILFPIERSCVLSATWFYEGFFSMHWWIMSGCKYLKQRWYMKCIEIKININFFLLKLHQGFLSGGYFR